MAEKSEETDQAKNLSNSFGGGRAREILAPRVLF